MEISRRASKLPASPIRKLVPFADEAKRKGVHVYHLNIGQPDILTPEVFMNAIRTYDTGVLAYGPSNGLLQYRAALQQYYRRWSINADPREIFVTTAGSEALLFAISSVADPGDNVLVMEPFYTNYNGFSAMLDVEVIGVPTKPESGFDIPSLDEFEKRKTERTKAILLCNPNNPTGAVYSRVALQKLADFAVSNGLYIISDEVYREFTYDGLTHTSLLHLENLEEHAIMVDSISKRYSACGARIGCLVTHNKQILDAVMKMGQARLCPPTLEQIGACAAIDTPDSYLQSVIVEYQMRRDVLFEHLMGIKGVYCEKPKGAFYMMVTLPVDNTDHFAQFMLEKFHSNKETVMVAPGAGFYASPGRGVNQVRMAYVLKAEDLIRSAEILKEGLSAYQSER